MSRPTVFISYSHKDKDLLGPLVAQLKALEQAGLLEVWADTRIDAGDKWYPEIEEAMRKAAVAVCLVSEYFLSSDFCTKQEVPFLLKRSADDGLLIVPVLLSECVWEAHRWLKETQMLPGEGQSIRTHFLQNPAAVFSRAAKTIFNKLNDPTFQAPSTPSVWLPLAANRVDLTRLPETGAALFGREQELELLDETWASAEEAHPERTRILAFTAHGGVGKSTLINHWLAEMARENYRGATRVFGWSFFSQGVRDQTVASADSFIDAALRFFGDPDPTAGAPWDKGSRLAGLVGRQRALVVLDGMEPLQSPHEFERGKLRDPSLESLLRGLARQSNGLCLITTREPLTELAGRSGVATRDLEQITPQAGRALLRTARVIGTDAELELLAEQFGPHALAVSLLGIYLYAQPGHGINPAKELEQLPGTGPIDRVLAGLEKWLGNSPEKEALRLLGFFDRPADAGSLEALRKLPSIPGLTNRLSALDNAQWNYVVHRLEKLRLIHTQRTESGKQFVDAHPLIREHFAHMLKGSDAWREGHRRLYEHLCATTKEGDQPTLEDLQPLYEAVIHGCQAGMNLQARAQIYSGRILFGDKNYSTFQLGAFASNLGAVACFFNTPWNRVAQEFPMDTRAWLLNEAAYALRCLGRLIEAIEPMRAGLDDYVMQGNWKAASIVAGNLTELELTLGEIRDALVHGDRILTYNKLAPEWDVHQLYRNSYAVALHYAGRSKEAGRLFRAIEKIQAGNQPHYPLLYSVGGFRYCDLLLAVSERFAWRVTLQLEIQNRQRQAAKARCLAISRRAEKTLGWAKEHRQGSLLDMALHQLTMGRAALYEAILNFPGSELRISNTALNLAVDGLRRASIQDQISSGLLTRSWLRSLSGNQRGSESAQEDLDQAWEIAERGPMRLHMADIHLYRARLFGPSSGKPKDEGGIEYPWNKNPDDSARGPLDDLKEARKLIEKCGYWRRKEELEDAEEAAKNW